MARDREPAGYVTPPDHTTRNLLIAAGTAAGAIGIISKIYPKHLKAAVNAALQKKTAEQTAAKVARKAEGEALFAKAVEKAKAEPLPDYIGATHKEIQNRVIPPSSVENQNVLTARSYLVRATQRHSELVKATPHRPGEVHPGDYKYWAPPFDAENKPRPGKYYHPEVYEKKKNQWYDNRAKALKAEKIQESRNADFRKTLMSRRVTPIEFDVSLKEGRGKNGKFQSASMPMLSPRDMQMAYHAPVLRSQPAAGPEAKPMSTGKKALIGGLGAAAGFAGLLAVAPGLRKKITGQAIEATEAAGAKVAGVGTKIAKGTREALDFKHTREINAIREAEAARTAATKARTEQEMTLRTGSRDAKIKDLTSQVAGFGAATTAAENARKVAEERLASHEAIKDTALKIAAGHADTPPIYGPNGPANAAARAAESHLVDTEGKEIGTPEGITKKLRARLAGDPESGQLGSLHQTRIRMTKIQTQLRNAPALGLSSLQVAKLKHTHAEQAGLLQKHSEILKRIDAGEISSIEAHGHLLAPDIDQIRSGRAQQISDEITSAAKAARERTKIGHKKLSAEAAKAREQAKLSKSEPGYPGHDYHGKAPTSKNRGKQFEDNRLIVRLCSVLQSVPRSDLHELSAFIRDVEVRHLPSNVQENIRKFIKVKPGTRVAHYSMVADELVGKSDPHNLATAEVNVRKRLSQKAAATEVHNRREIKPILVMNDRVVDGHHFIGKAMHGKVSSSLHVLDLTPARFQMETLKPGMIEL